jgi:hypothetical protein
MEILLQLYFEYLFNACAVFMCILIGEFINHQRFKFLFANHNVVKSL